MPVVLDIPESINQQEPVLFYCKVKDGNAKGYYNDDRFVVLAGSLIRRQNSSFKH